MVLPAGMGTHADVADLRPGEADLRGAFQSQYLFHELLGSSRISSRFGPGRRAEACLVSYRQLT
jgi:hypothetical protein